MSWFIYKGFDQYGSKASGQIEAESKDLALLQLEKKEIFVSELNLIAEKKVLDFSFSDRINLNDLELLTSELSILLNNGVKIDRGLDIITRNISKPSLSILLKKVNSQLKKGSSLADALDRHQKVFGQLYINLIRLGEASGTLPVIFNRLSEDLRFKQSLGRKISQATVYPAVILMVCISSIFFVFNFIVPRMAGLFADIPELPWYTVAMLSVSSWFNTYQLHMLGVFIFATLLFVWAWNQKQYKVQIKTFFFNMPGFRRMSLLVDRIRFNSGLTMMLEAGVAIDQAIKLSAGSVDNPLTKQELEICVKKVSSGAILSKTLAETSLYPDFYVALLQVGEETASLPSVFDEITRRSRDEFELKSNKMTALLEPLLILFMGAIVGSVVVVMLMSMVSVNDVSF